MKKELIADLIVGENVIVLDKKGCRIDEGVITRIQKSDKKSGLTANWVYVFVDENKYSFCSQYYHNEYFFNAERFNLALSKKITYELADVLAKNINYAK